MASAPYPLTSETGVISSPFPIRQFEVRNLTPAAVYLKAGGAIPSSQTRDWVFLPGEERMGPPIHANSLAWRLSSVQTLSPPTVIVYDEVQQAYQSLRELDEQCPNYPFVTQTKNAWVLLPTISPNGHVPVTFWLHAAYIQGDQAMLLAHDLDALQSSVGGSQLIYACTRAGIYPYGFPEPYLIRPKLFVRKGTDPGATDIDVTVDAWYTYRPHYWRPEVNQYDARASLPSLGAGAANLMYYGLMPGYWDFTIYYKATLATTVSVQIQGETFVSSAGGIDAFDYVPSTAVVLGATALLKVAFRRMLTIQHPQIVWCNLTNTGVNSLNFMTMWRKI